VTAQTFTVFAWPPGCWGVAVNGRPIPILFDTLADAALRARLLTAKFGPAAPAPTPDLTPPPVRLPDSHPS